MTVQDREMYEKHITTLGRFFFFFFFGIYYQSFSMKIHAAMIDAFFLHVGISM